MSAEIKDPIIIVGGGIGGFAMARTLALKSIPSILLEKADEFAEVGAGIQLGPNVYKMFDRLEVTEAIRNVAFFPENLIMMDSTSATEIMRMPLGEAFQKRFSAPYSVIHRADLHDTLIEACKGSDYIELHNSVEVTGYREEGEKVVVETKDGREFTGSALIGADGLWSSIRPSIVGDGKPDVSGHIAYRAVLPTEEVPDHLRSESVVLWGGPKNHLVHYPLRRGELYNLVVVFHSDRYVEGWDSFGDVEEMRKHFEGTCDQVQEWLSKIDQWRMWVLCDREPVKNWSKGKVTLIGDAAHPMLQYLAAGAGMSIEDAVVLTDEIIAHKFDFENAFLAYQNKRYLRTGRVQLTARIYGEIYHAGGVKGELRNMMLAGRTDQQAYDGVAWLYDGIE